MSLHVSPCLRWNADCYFIVYKWLIAGTFQASIKSPSNTWGLVGLVAFDLIFFCSTDWWRKNAYNFFITTHVVGFCLLFPAVRPTLLTHQRKPSHCYYEHRCGSTSRA